jgi:cytochrome P450
MKDGKKFSSNVPTMMHELIYGSLPDSEKTLKRILEEAQSLVGAGSVTTAWILSVIMFHLIDKPKYMELLQKELKPVIERTNGRPEWKDLEGLPFLTAIIKEGLRVGYGNPKRLPRIHDSDLQFRGWTIPKGTPVSMSSMLVHTDLRFFPDADKFIPERWLSSDGVRLDQYLVSFSKGPRACLGMHLAYAEIYLALSVLVAPGGFKYTLFKTDNSDVEPKHDFSVVAPRLDSKGVRVRVE